VERIRAQLDLLAHQLQPLDEPPRALAQVCEFNGLSAHVVEKSMFVDDLDDFEERSTQGSYVRYSLVVKRKNKLVLVGVLLGYVPFTLVVDPVFRGLSEMGQSSIFAF
jgi:hypothetical protein